MQVTRRLSRATGVAVLVIFVAVALLAGRNFADNGVNVQLHGFEDTRGVTVLSPLVSLDKDFTERSGLRLKFGVDAISAASDSCARCHPSGVNSRHDDFSASFREKIGDYKLDVGGEVSRENFYSADTASASLSRDFNKGNTTIAGAYSVSWNRPQLHPSENVESQISQEASATLTQTLTRGTIVQLTYDFNRISGFQSSPFLRTLVNNQMQVGQSPDLRSRHAFVVRLRQALPADTYLEADYRRYVDSWSIASNAFSIGASHYFTPAFLFGFSYRKYGQTGAFFYQPQYFGTPQFFTGDFRLAPFDSGLYAGKLTFTPKGGFWGLPDGTAFSLQYERYRATTDFQAATISTGLHIPF